MTRVSISDADLISYDSNGGYLDVNFSYVFPLTQEDIKDFYFEKCILTLIVSDGKVRKYVYCEYLTTLTLEILNLIVSSYNASGFYVSYLDEPDTVIKKIKNYNSII